MSGAALSDKITFVSFIEDGVAQEVKRRVDIKAAACNDDGRGSAVMPKILNSVPLHLCGCMCSTS